MIAYNAIILAAGSGKRMNAGENKQFIELKERPLIIHTLNTFDKDEWCKAIILVINPAEKERFKQLLYQYPLATSVKLVEGGSERQESVFCGLKVLEDPDDIVFIHDGARPFVKEDHLHQLAKITKEKQAALLAVPVTDTIKQLIDGKLTSLDRKTLWAAQTPQAFLLNVIYKAHQLARDEGFLGTDDASLVERMGQHVEIVEGSYDNIKLTTPEDLQRALAYLD